MELKMKTLKSSLMCINDLDNKGKPFNKNVYGDGGSYRTLEFNFIPCVPKQLTIYNRHLVNKECIADLKDPKSLKAKLEASRAYLGRPNL